MVIVIALFVAMTIATSHDISGRYYSQDNPSDYIELFDDGRFLVSQENAFCGDYTVSGDTVTLVYMFGKFELQHNGNTLIDEDGAIWKKK